MMLYNDKNNFTIIKFDDFGVDLVSYKSITAYLLGEVNPEQHRDEMFVLEFIPFAQQLATISSDSEGYDRETNMTKVRLDLNSMSYQNYKYLVYSATKIINPINKIVRACEKASYPTSIPHSLPKWVKVVGQYGDEAYLDIKDHSDLVIPVSECFRQFRLNQNYVEYVNARLGLINLVKRVGIKKTIRIDKAISFESKSELKAVPSLIVAYQFTPQEWGAGQTRYKSAGYYEVKQTVEGDAYVLKWAGHEYTGKLDEGVEVILVGLNDNYEYNATKDEIIEVTNIAQTKLDELEHNYNFEVKTHLDGDDVSSKNIFECLGELINLQFVDGYLSAQLTGFTYDGLTKEYTLVFGTKRIGIDKIIKELTK